MEYHIKSVKANAIQWTGSNLVELIAWTNCQVTPEPDGSALVMTRSGSAWIPEHGWLVRDGDQFITYAAGYGSEIGEE